MITTTTNKTIVSNNNKQQNTTNRKPATARQPETRQTLPGSLLTYVRGGHIEQSKAQTMLVGVNAQGHMQIGLAGAMAKAHPEIVSGYQNAVQHGNFQAGSARRAITRDGQQLLLMGIWNMQEYGAKLEWLRNSLTKVFDAASTGSIEIKSIATVKLGCRKDGVNGLDWKEVGPLVASYLSALGVPAEIYVGREDEAYFVHYNEQGEAVTTAVAPEQMNELNADDGNNF